MQQLAAQREANRAPWRTNLANGEQQLEALRHEPPPAQPNPANLNAYNARIAQVDQQINQYRNLMGSPQYNAAQKAGWKPALDQFEILKAELTRRGPAGYDQGFDNRLQQASNLIQQGRAQLAAFDAQEAQQNAPIQQQIAQQRQQREALVQKGPNRFSPEYDAEMTRLDAAIAQTEAQVRQFQANPAYAAQLNNARNALATNQQAKQQLLAQDPREFSPQFHARVTQVDQQIAGLENNIRAYPQPNYAANRAQWGTQLEQLRQQKGAIVAMGADAYDPGYEQKLNQAAQQVTNAKAQLTNVTAQLDAPLDTAKREVATANALKAELVKHGALKYNPSYEQRLTQIDQQNGQLEASIRMPNYNDAQKAQWRAQIQQNDKIAEDLRARGPENYHPNEPQIQAQRQQIENYKQQMAPLRAQLDIALAAAKPDDIKQKFAGILDQALLGAPPGGGVQEALHH
jgi:hypothetical protein